MLLKEGRERKLMPHLRADHVHAPRRTLRPSTSLNESNLLSPQSRRHEHPTHTLHLGMSFANSPPRLPILLSSLTKRQPISAASAGAGLGGEATLTDLLDWYQDETEVDLHAQQAAKYERGLLDTIFGVEELETVDNELDSLFGKRTSHGGKPRRLRKASIAITAGLVYNGGLERASSYATCSCRSLPASFPSAALPLEPLPHRCGMCAHQPACPILPHLPTAHARSAWGGGHGATAIAHQSSTQRLGSRPHGRRLLRLILSRPKCPRRP